MKFTTATSIKYGNYKHLQHMVEKATEMVKRVLPKLRKEIDFRDDVEIHFRPIRGATAGRAFQHRNIIEVDPRMKMVDLLEIVAHELVHSEQYKQGRLNHQGAKAIYEGKTYTQGRFGSKAYYNDPWEVEAYSRAAALRPHLELIARI